MSEPVLLESIVARGQVTRRDSHSAIVTSQALDWPGMLVEAGRNDVAAVDDLVGDQHYLSLNLDSAPLQLEVKQPHGFQQYTVPPQSLWVSPSADPITLRLNSTLHYLRVSIDPLHLGRLISPSLDDVGPVRLRRTYAVQSPQMAHLMLALRAEADDRNPGGLATIEAVTTALGNLLVRAAGIEQPRPARVHGGLSSLAKRRVLELIDAGLDARLTIESLAQEVGLSGRAFRARVQADARPGAASVPPGTPVGAGPPAHRNDRCEPVGHRAAHGVRRSASLHETLQARLRHDSGRADAGNALAALRRQQSRGHQQPGRRLLDHRNGVTLSPSVHSGTLGVQRGRRRVTEPGCGRGDRSDGEDN